VSLESNYRGRFIRVIQTSSYQTLLRELRVKRGESTATFWPAGRPVEAGLSPAR
jgi:hypothetical protein